MLMAAALVIGAVAIQGDAKTKSKSSTKRATSSTKRSSSTVKEAGKHMDFMGIPINGTISNFSTKLASKGFKATKKSLTNGTKTFSGNYFNWPASLYVYYIPSTKLVYRVKVVISSYTDTSAGYLMGQLLAAYEEKYEGADTEEGEHDGYDAYEMIVYDWDNVYPAGTDENGELQYIVPYLGWIDIFMSYDYLEYSVFVDFFDWENYQKYEDWLKTTI